MRRKELKGGRRKKEPKNCYIKGLLEAIPDKPGNCMTGTLLASSSHANYAKKIIDVGQLRTL